MTVDSTANAMQITLQEAQRRLDATGRVVPALVKDVEVQEARWRPSPEQWSILEVINHLADEEAEDFRTRLDLLLHRPGEPWPPIDPEGWVNARGYAERDLAESLDRFRRERRNSLSWLGTLESPAWDREYEHPGSGRLTAGSLLASWLAHDLLHIRQLTRLRYRYLASRVLPHSPEYAGGW